jgi:haloalkane dehalogenase
MRHRSPTVLVVAALMVAACSGDDAPTEQPDVGSAPTSTTQRQQTGGLTDQYGQRYCEVLALTFADTGTTGEVWGTQGINDCPQAGLDMLDPTIMGAALEVDIAVINGPRFWVLDEIVANGLAGSGELRDLGGLEMRSIALVELGPGVPDRTPLTETSVARDTEFIFAADRQIHELTAPDGSVYIMQSYSEEIDPTLTLDELAGLGDRLDLPDGWSFTSRVLDEALVVEDLDGVATVIQDEFRNSYQLRSRG